MGIFDYEAVSKTGEVVKGQVEAEGEPAALQKLQQSGLMVLELRELKTSSLSGLFRRKGKVGPGDLALFSRQMAAMLDAGIPITRSLFTLSLQAENRALREVLDGVAQDVEGGMTLTEAVQAHPRVFSNMYVGMIQAGEMGGTLEMTLNALAEQLQKDKALLDNVRSATFYPGAIAAFSVLLLLGMLLFLVPVFEGFFPPGTVLPLPTRIIMGLSRALRGYWHLVFPLAGLSLYGLGRLVKSPRGTRQLDRIKFRLPAFGPLLHRSVIARFSRTLSTLMSGGIPVVQALENAGPASGNILVQRAVEGAAERIQEGRSLAKPLEESGMFPPMVIQMISVGEETGALPELLTKVADFYEEEVAVMAKGLTTMIEPILLVVVGITVGAMIIALYLPIFQVITQGM